MLGKRVAYDWMPYFGSRQYDLDMEYTGHADDWDDIVFRGDPANRRFTALYLDDGRVLAGRNAGVRGVSRHVRALVARGLSVDRDRLADPAVNLSDLSGYARPAAVEPRLSTSSRCHEQ